MENNKWLLISFFFGLCILLSGCDLFRSKERITIGGDTVVVSGSSGKVEIFVIDTAGKTVQSYNTHAFHSYGWSIRKIGPERVRVFTGDVGDYDIFKEKSEWMILPTGTFLSPSKTTIVKLHIDRTPGNIEAVIGESEPPYTDLFIDQMGTFPGHSVDQFYVKWSGDHHAEVYDSAGKRVADLHASNK